MSYGRRKIYSDAREITAANVMDEVNRAYAVHCQNQSEKTKTAESDQTVTLGGYIYIKIALKKVGV